MNQRDEEPEPSSWVALVGGLALVAGTVVAAGATAAAASRQQNQVQQPQSYRTIPIAPQEPSYPSEVLFTQISVTLRVNHRGQQVPLLSLVDAVLDEQDVPPIRIVYHDGRWRSIDNHRLFAFQLYEKLRHKKPSQHWFQIAEKTLEFENKNRNVLGCTISVGKNAQWNYEFSEGYRTYQDLVAISR
eukprot:TRINITY_DN4210_c0_g1_i1.p1 TRINITY_DN4210_c0_g1~~TRINITY_DN4210_c0_g1_i1.p1  ORF type:complete len:187 (-),score=14.36 TRINITY_DN4210_c0_g1_i1:88-648(-)